jgi:hypothetical protein
MNSQSDYIYLVCLSWADNDNAHCNSKESKRGIVWAVQLRVSRDLTIEQMHLQFFLKVKRLRLGTRESNHRICQQVVVHSLQGYLVGLFNSSDK